MSLTETKVVGSPQQEAFWKALVDGESHLILEARAGSGKTFSCIEGSKRYMEKHDGRVIMVAYNKSIASELEAKVPEGVEACTMHSLGFKAIRDAVGKVKVDGWKTANLLEDMYGSREAVENVSPTFASNMKKVVSLAKNTMLPLDFSDADFNDLVIHYNLQLNGDESVIRDMLMAVLVASRNQVDVIDFDDMIWLPLVKEWDLPQYDLMFVDEAQDLNKSRQLLAMAAASRLVLVGAPKQAIYGFTGADAYSMTNMENILHAYDIGCEVLPLTVSRRCPKSHVAKAQEIVADIQAMDDAPEGTINSVNASDLPEVLSGGELVLCRMNAPLMKVAYQLIQNDTPVAIQGRDIGTGLANLCKKIAKKKMSMDIIQFLDAMELYTMKEVERLDRRALVRRVSQSQYEMLHDRLSCITIISQGLSTVGDLVDRLKALFTDTDKSKKNRKVLLSSVHRAKGLEADKVFILEPQMMPHPMAELEWEQDQEMNIKYVALTRSLDTLTFVITE